MRATVQKKRKWLAVILALTMVVLCGCGGASAPVDSAFSPDEGGEMRVVATNFPAYDFARAVCGDGAQVTMLLPPGAESHSYEPTPADILLVQGCGLFIYTGGESDTWVDTILESLDTPVNTLRMVECVPLLEEETLEGMTSHEEPKEDGMVEYDEHVWTAPANAAQIVRAVEGQLETLDVAHAATYRENAENYVQKIEVLDQAFEDFFDAAPNKTLVFGDRFPLRYFAQEYGLTCYAAFPGCSTQTEPSAATIAFLTDKVKEEHLTTVYYIEFSNHLVADSIAEATGTTTALIHSCHNVSQAEMDEGVTYVSLMERNLETLRQTMPQ